MPLSMLVIKATLLVVIPVILHLAAFVLLVFPIIPIPLVVIVIVAAFFVIVPIIFLLDTFLLVIVILCNIFVSNSTLEDFQAKQRERHEERGRSASQQLRNGSFTLRAMSCNPRLLGWGTQAAVALCQS